MIEIERALKIDGWMEPDELQWLADQVYDSDKTLVLEIGSHKGRSTRAINDNLDGRMICIDRWLIEDDYRNGFETNLRDAIEYGGVIPIRASSMEAFKFLRACFDMIFIDADHNYDAVVDDITCWRTRLNPGGLLCGHDLDHEYFPGVRAALEHLGIKFKKGPGLIWYQTNE